MFGIEREALRVAIDGNIVKTDHPHQLGSKLTHPHFTTDFGEAQLEIVTPPYSSIKEAMRSLSKLHRYYYQMVQGEHLWPLSMPPPLDKIRIADFGTSSRGIDKRLYREGLAKRYPIEMQMISGIHANFSFEKTLSNDAMMGIIRNFLRHGWLLTYLFGASPSRKFPYSTSMRLSEKGYYSRIQNQIAISFNSYEAYLSDLEKALSTPHAPYKGYGLNSNLLQIPGEHYTRIRPKSIREGHIDYLEIRSLDLNPYAPMGVSPSEIQFTYDFLKLCHKLPSPPLHIGEIKTITENQNRVALYGRKPKLMLLTARGKKQLSDWAYELLDQLEMPDQIAKIDNPKKCPSAQLLKDLQGRDWVELGMELAETHRKKLLTNPLSDKDIQILKNKAVDSIQAQKDLELDEDLHFRDYEDLEVSTQVIIRKALEKEISVEVLDRTKNIIRLTKGRKSTIIQQATKTELDTYITPLIMDNKAVTKQLLKEAGFNVPDGDLYHNAADARADYHRFSKHKVAVKPNTTNFGVGITFIPPNTPDGYARAVQKAFNHSETVLVETFCPGSEHRFLIIDQKVIGVLNRVPANVTGDGIHTISQLVKLKNRAPKNHKHLKNRLKITPFEMAYLKQQNLTPLDIPPKGKTIYLRENSNISSGGDPIDVTDTIHPSYGKIAICATKHFNAHFCGVDMLIPHPHTDGSYTIIEMNYNPTLAIHAYPYKGTPRDVATPLLKSLGF